VAKPRGDDERPAGVHRTPRALFADAINRSLGWASETELRDLVLQHTGVRLGLGAANRFSQEVAAIVVRGLGIALSKKTGHRR
jgi:hypothetical protein